MLRDKIERKNKLKIIKKRAITKIRTKSRKKKK
jgi:hypothetical protein